MISMCADRLVDGATLNCPGQFQAMSLRATTNDSGLAPPCLPDYVNTFFKSIPCCNSGSTFDNTHLQCRPPGGQPPDYHEPSPQCPDGTNATWFSRTEMQGGLHQCSLYTCDWGAPWHSLASETCPSDVCANPTWLSIPMCTAGASRNEGMSSLLIAFKCPVLRCKYRSELMQPIESSSACRPNSRLRTVQRSMISSERPLPL
jgi:hypothetical protein